MVSSKTWPAIASWRSERPGASWARVRTGTRSAATALEALAFATAAPLLLRAQPARLARLLEPRHEASPPSDERIAETIRMTDAVLARARPLVRTGCLTRGVTRYRTLRRVGVDVSLCFGAGSVNGTIEAHCWLDHRGGPLLEPADVDQFVEMFRICRPGVVMEAA